MSRRVWKSGESEKTHYEVLGVKTDCTQEEIKRAFVELSKEHHPDVPGGNTERSKRINVAYTVLSRADERRKYDGVLQSVTWKPNPVEDPRPATWQEIYRMYGFPNQANYQHAGRSPRILMTAFALFILSGMTMSFVLTQRDRLRPLEDDGYGPIEDDNYTPGSDIIARRAARSYRRIRDRTRSHGSFENQLRFVEKVVLKNPSSSTTEDKN